MYLQLSHVDLIFSALGVIRDYYFEHILGFFFKRVHYCTNTSDIWTCILSRDREVRRRIGPMSPLCQCIAESFLAFHNTLRERGGKSLAISLGADGLRSERNGTAARWELIVVGVIDPEELGGSMPPVTGWKGCIFSKNTRQEKHHSKIKHNLPSQPPNPS